MGFKYILVTPAHNEEQTLPDTIASICAQTVVPLGWAIVDDSSSDGTGSVATDAARQNSFIKSVRRTHAEKRSFSGKVAAIQVGLKALEKLDCDYVAFLDADISVEPTFFEQLLTRMEADPMHGLAGGGVFERCNGNWELIKSSYDMSVAGAVQVFRRTCYEQIGGYRPMPYGGVDTIVEVAARMWGWKVKSFPDLKVYHHHAQGRTHGSRWLALYRNGLAEYVIGYHPLFQLGRFFTWLPQRPYLIASFIRTAGYFSGLFRSEPRVVSKDFVKYLQKEQLERLMKFCGFMCAKN